MADVIDVPTGPRAGTPVTTPAGGSPLLFGRWWNLVVGTAEGETTSLQQFHVQFSVQMHAMQSPWTMEATVINVPPALAAKITSRYTTVALAGGYKQVQRGDLFSGLITFFEYGKLSPTETFLRIYAATTDTAYSQSIINQNLPAGHKTADVVNACLDAMSPFGVSLGHLSPLSDNQSPRGRLLFGLPRDVLRDIAQSENAQVWIDGAGKLYVLKGDDTSYQPDTIDINMSNGMVNLPSQQVGAGIRVQCLLNYRVLPGTLIKLNQAQINQVVPTDQAGLQPDTGFNVLATAPLNAGIFRAWSVHHTGDSRGTPWYTDITTEPVNADQAGIGINS